MPFKLPSFVANVSLWLLLPAEIFAVPADILGFKGSLFSLSSTAVKTMDIRSDGRYLFYSSGSNSFSVLDLLDMGRFGETVTTNGDVIGVFMDGDTRLSVATSKGVQYFDIAKPLKPVKSTFLNQDYVRTTDPGLAITDACALNGNKIALLEKDNGSTNAHKIRIVTGIDFVVSPSWTAVSNSQPTLKPFAVRCSGNSVIVASFENNLNFDSATKIYFSVIASTGALSSAAQSFQISSSYRVGDFVLSEKKDQLLVLFNRETNLNQTDDSVLMTIPAPSIGGQSTFSVGSQAQAVSSFKEGSDFQTGIFVGDDRLSNLPDRSNKLLLSNLPFVGGIQDDRGPGFAGVGLHRPSLWVSSGDDYKYGLTLASGIALISRGPKVEITEAPSTTTLSSSQPLKFKLKADRDLSYAIYFDQTYSLDGTSSGLNREPGALIKRGNLLKDLESDEIEVTAAELGIFANRRHSLSIVAYDPSLNASTAPLTRLGIPFAFDPPPGAVRNLRLEFGDSAIFVRFDPPLVEDLASYSIHFSYDPNDLSDPLSDTPRTFNSGVNGQTLISPVVVNALEFSGEQILKPIKNESPLYVRVYAIDATNQKGEASALMKRTPYRTLSLPQALGSAESCSLRAPLPGESLKSLWLQFFFICCFLGILRALKKIGPSTSRNRRGGD